jgi:hypothetical protein
MIISEMSEKAFISSFVEEFSFMNNEVQIIYNIQLSEGLTGERQGIYIFRLARLKIFNPVTSLAL